MLVNIGLGSNAGVQDANFNMYYMLGSFFSNGPSATKAAMGDAYGTMVLYVLTTFIGIFAIAVMHHKKVKGFRALRHADCRRGSTGSAASAWVRTPSHRWRPPAGMPPL